MYIDDTMKSVSSEEKGVGLQCDLTELLGRAEMKTKKWCSNEPGVLREILVEDRSGYIHLEDGIMSSTKTLEVL